MAYAFDALKWATFRFPVLIGAMTAIGIMFGVAVGMLGMAYVAARQSVTIYNVSATYRPAKKIVEIEFEYSRRHLCVTQGVARELWTLVDGPDGSLRKYAIPLGSGPASTNESGSHMHAIYAFRLPDETWPGIWYYHSNAADYCGALAGLFGPIQRDVDNVEVKITK